MLASLSFEMREDIDDAAVGILDEAGSGGPHQLDGAGKPRRSRQLRVRRQQREVQSLRQCDVQRVVEREVLAKLPSCSAQHLGRLVSNVDEPRGVIEQHLCIGRRQLAGQDVPTQHVADLGVDEMGGVRGLVHKAATQDASGRRR